jgi:hypothetical protein
MDKWDATFCVMTDAPRGALARATLVDAARCLAAALSSPPDATRADPPVHALERAVAAYVAAHGTGMGPRALSGMVASRVRAAFRTGDEAGYSGAVIGRVVSSARRAVGAAIAEEVGAVPGRRPGASD